MRARIGAWAILLAMGLAWGLTFPLARIVAVGGVHPFSITFWEAVIAATLLVAFRFARRRAIPLSRELALLYLAAGLLGMAVPNVIFFYAAAHVPAGILSITIAIVPILTFAGSAALRIETVMLGRIAGVLLGMAAVVLLVSPEQSLPDPAQLPWVLVSLLAAGCYAALNVMLARWSPQGATPSATAAGMFVAATLTMVPVLTVTGSFQPLGWPWTAVEWSMVGLGVIGGIAYSLYLHLIETAGPVFSSQTANLVTLFGVLWGIVLLGEQHSGWIWLSLATMMAAVALVTPKEKLSPAA